MRGSLLNRRILQRFRLQAFSVLGSSKIKLLLCCCVLFTIVLFAASFMGWKHHHHHHQAASSSSSSHLDDTKKGYTILINTWKRNDLLKQSISHYTTCAGLDSVHIVWSEPDPPTDSLRDFLQHILQSNSRGGRNIELKFDINKEDSLNNRFKDVKDLKTDAIFSIDDDVVFPCNTVELAFSVWLSAQDTMVGFVPRVHWVDKTKPSLNQYTYGGWWSVWWMGTYSMVLSKAAFFHKKYLGLYTNQMPVSIRDYITKNRNCEDIAMSFLVANATGAPPIWVKGMWYLRSSSNLIQKIIKKSEERNTVLFPENAKGTIFETGSTGISSLGGHNERRSECVNRFVVEYGHMPLVSTSVKAVDSRNNWFW